MDDIKFKRTRFNDILKAEICGESEVTFDEKKRAYDTYLKLKIFSIEKYIEEIQKLKIEYGKS
jgi:hypothetical protein